jgi:signal transduction histidine kinase
VHLTRIFKTSSFKLAALYTAVTAIAFSILLIVIYWIATEALSRQVRDGVAAEFADLASHFRSDNAAALAAEISARIASKRPSNHYYFLSDRNGHRLTGNYDLGSIFEGWREEPFEATGVSDTGDGDDDHQLIGFGQHLPDGSFLLVGEDGNRVLTAQEAIIQAFGWASGLALALSALVGLFASQGFLRRVDAINATSQAIMAGHLKERIPVRGTSDELDRLAQNLNRMLDRSQSLMESLKQVSSSIAHDLKTPLSRLRQGLEEALLSANTTGEFKVAIDRAIEDSDTILATFSALLRIAQIESGIRKSGFKAVSLSAIFERIAEAYGAVAEDEGRSFVQEIEPGLAYFGDEELLLQMLANLIENCLRHTERGTPISMKLTCSDARLQAVIADAGAGIPAAERHRVFEHFYQINHSRNAAGNGLGLALVSAVADLHGIAVELADNSPGLIVKLDFGPAQPSPSKARESTALPACPNLNIVSPAE